MKTNIFVILVFVLVFLSGRSGAAPEEAPDFLGKLNSKECEGTEYYYYIPKTARAKRKTALRTLVLVHGEDVIAEKFVARWAEVAEKRFVAIIAPVFEPNAFGDYGELNIKGPRADLRLLEIVKDANSIWPMKSDKFYIYGHSAGGEFAHRFAMVHPERIAKGAASCAGSYTFPEPNVEYPYGVKQAGDIKFDVDGFAGLNFGIIVGALDTDPNGLGGPDTQGKDRVERAQNFYNAMKKHAKDNGIACKLRFAKIPKAGHDFRGTTVWSERYFFRYTSEAGGKRSLVRGSIVSDERKKAAAKKAEDGESSTGSGQGTSGQSISPLLEQFLKESPSNVNVTAGGQIGGIFELWEAVLRHESMDIYIEVEAEGKIQKDHVWKDKTRREILDEYCQDNGLVWKITKPNTIRIEKKADGKESSTDNKQGANSKMVLMRCQRQDCGAIYQMGITAFVKAQKKQHAKHPDLWAAPLLVCEKCGEESAYRAERCPKCDLVFKTGSMGAGYFPDKCPDCGFSPTEAKRLERAKK